MTSRNWRWRLSSGRGLRQQGADSAAASRLRTLFTDDAVIGADSREPAHDECFRGPVVFGDQIGRGRLGMCCERTSGPARCHQIAGLTSQLFSECQQRAVTCVEVGIVHGWRSFSRASTSRHSPSARNTSTATTLIPTAATTAPMNSPNPRGRPQLPVHCSFTRVYPMSPPAQPPMMMAAKAATRAAGDGRADRGRSSGATTAPI